MIFKDILLFLRLMVGLAMALGMREDANSLFAMRVTKVGVNLLLCIL